MYERETRREKILESRNRELKLKEKTGAGAHGDDVKKSIHLDLSLLEITYLL